MSEKKTCCAVKQNPLMLLLLGATPAMAMTTGVVEALGMGLSVLLITLLTGILVSALKKIIPENGKLAACVLISAGVTGLVQQVMAAWLPGLYFAGENMALYLGVVAVSPFVFRHVDKVASRAGIGTAVKDALSTGVFFLVVMVIVAAIREVLGAGSIAGVPLNFLKDYTTPILTQAFGGFVVYAMAAAVIGAKRPADCCCCEEGE